MRATLWILGSLAVLAVAPPASSQVPGPSDADSWGDIVCMDGNEIRILGSCPSVVVERTVCSIREDLCALYRQIEHRVSLHQPDLPLLP